MKKIRRALIVRRGGVPALRRKLTPARSTRPRPTSPEAMKAVAMPANWTTPTPKIPATALLEHADRLAPGGDLFVHRQKLKGLQRLQRDLQGFEMIFDRVMTGGAEHLPGFFHQWNAVNIRASVTVFLNALRLRTAEEIAHTSVADVEHLQEAHAGFKQAMRGAEEKRARLVVVPNQPQILAGIRQKVAGAEVLDPSEVQILAESAMSAAEGAAVGRVEVKILIGIAQQGLREKTLGVFGAHTLVDLERKISGGHRFSRSEVKELVKDFGKKHLAG
jgi:hypothetical protein